jgi:hypothetical protein
VRSKSCLSWAGSTKLTSSTPAQKNNSQLATYNYERNMTSKTDMQHAYLPIIPRPWDPGRVHTLQKG